LATRIATLILCGRMKERDRHQTQSIGAMDRDRAGRVLLHAGDEFQTPLTILLGTLSHLAESPRIPQDARAKLSLSWRHALEVLKLVNILTDIEQIQAGQMNAAFAPEDLSALTAELANMFRPAIEAAKLRLVVECPPLADLAYVDRPMWEKIV